MRMLQDLPPPFLPWLQPCVYCCRIYHPLLDRIILNAEVLSTISYINLEHNQLTGTVPGTIFNLPLVGGN